MEFIGFHGTSLDSGEKIRNEGFIPSIGDEEWIGDGAYFFINGLSKLPEIQAENWAILSAWDKVEKKNLYKDYCVIKVDIEVDDEKLIDLRTSDGQDIFQILKESMFEALKKSRRRLGFLDGKVLNFAKKKKLVDFHAVIGDYSIKLTLIERRFDLKFRTPNATICSICEPNICISDLEIFKTGKIS